MGSEDYDQCSIKNHELLNFDGVPINVFAAAQPCDISILFAIATLELYVQKYLENIVNIKVHLTFPAVKFS